jgi:hypothetical protein
MACVLAAALAFPAVPGVARADGASGAADAGTAGPASAAAAGIAVLARAGAEAAGWALAKEVYARPFLRPPALDEARARVLVGDAPASDAPQAVRDLADERATIHGDDGASRALLRTIASQLGVRAIVVVEPGANEPSVRVFIAETGAFDAARYAADPVPQGAVTLAAAPAAPAASSDGGMAPVAPAIQPPAPPPASPPLHWSGTVASLDRTYGNGGPETRAPALATSPLPPEAPKTTESRPFYASPWFWGAIGAAAFGGAAVYFATRDNTTGTIHLDLQNPSATTGTSK